MKGRSADILAFIIMASFWAINYPVLKISFDYDDPFAILFFRILFAGLSALLIFYHRLIVPRGLKTNLKIFAVGLLSMVLFMSFWFLGEQLEPASLSSILVYTFPIFSLVFSGMFLGDRLTRETILASILGFSGVVLIFIEQIGLTSIFGAFLLVISAVFWALGTIFYKKYLGGINPVSVNTLQLLYSIPILFIIAVVVSPAGVFNVNYQTVLLTLILGVPGTAVAYLIYFHLFRKYDVSEISSYFFAVPALSIVFSFAILGEKSSFLTYVGFVMISVGMFVSYSRKRKTAGNNDLINM